MLELSSRPHLSGDSPLQRPSLWMAVLAGLVTASATAVLVCRSPQAATPQLLLVLLAAAYLMVTALSGATGSFLVWIRSHGQSERVSNTNATSELSALLQSTANGWVWIPAIVLLSRQDSMWAPMVAAAGATVLAVSLRKSGPKAAQGQQAFETSDLSDIADSSEPVIFAETLKTPATEWYGPLVAVCLFSEGFVLAQGWLFPACALLAIAGFAFAWARTSAAPSGQQSVRKLTSVTIRQTSSALPALIVTVLALLIGVSHDIGAWGLGSGIAHRNAAGEASFEKSDARLGAGGHVSIILLSAPQKQQILAPRPKSIAVQPTRLTKPMVLQFDGEYWYLQPGDSTPGPGAFRVHGSPLGTGIHSVSDEPLVMQAHQHLNSPLPIECCREIDVEIENRPGQGGALAMGMALTDSTDPEKAPMLLEMQAITANQASSTGNGVFAHASLRFRIPAKAIQQLRQFDQIDFAILSDPAHATTGAKVAIRSLEFIP